MDPEELQQQLKDSLHKARKTANRMGWTEMARAIELALAAIESVPIPSPAD